LRHWTAGKYQSGFIIDSSFFLGIFHDAPLMVIYANELGIKPTFRKILDLERAQFRDLSKEGQYGLIVGFLREAIAAVPKETAS
jgi:hypothetical protein